MPGRNDNGGGLAPTAGLVVPAQDTGPHLRPQGCFASRCARHASGVPLTPEPPRPLRQETRAGPGLPHPKTRAPQDQPPRSTSLQPKSPRFEGIDKPLAATGCGDDARRAFDTANALLPADPIDPALPFRRTSSGHAPACSSTSPTPTPPLATATPPSPTPGRPAASQPRSNPTGTNYGSTSSSYPAAPPCEAR